MMLITMQYDIELQTQFIMQHKLFLQKASGAFVNLKADYEPGSQADRVLEARVHQLTEAEKILDMRIQTLKSRGDAISKEMEDTKQLVKKAAERFKDSYGGMS